MSEIKSEVKTYEIDMVCDKCGQGYMRPVGNIVLTTSPLQYPHECTECGYMATYNKTYPYTAYEHFISVGNGIIQMVDE